MPQVKTFLRLTETENLEINRIKNMMGSWNYSFLPSKTRTFLFKFYNNILGLNSRVAKFNQNTDPSCTFCSINNLRPAPKESFTHLFYYCDTTKKILAEFFTRFFTIETPNCATFFCGNLSEKEPENRSFQLVMDVLRYYIWSSKLENKTPVISNLFMEVNDTLCTIYKMSPKAREYAVSCNFFRHGGE